LRLRNATANKEPARHAERVTCRFHGLLLAWSKPRIYPTPVGDVCDVTGAKSGRLVVPNGAAFSHNDRAWSVRKHFYAERTFEIVVVNLIEQNRHIVEEIAA
jgi:hypothetical protein